MEKEYQLKDKKGFYRVLLFLPLITVGMVAVEILREKSIAYTWIIFPVILIFVLSLKKWIYKIKLTNDKIEVDFLHFLLKRKFISPLDELSIEKISHGTFRSSVREYIYIYSKEKLIFRIDSYSFYIESDFADFATNLKDNVKNK